MRKIDQVVLALLAVSSLVNATWRSTEVQSLFQANAMILLICIVLAGILSVRSVGVNRILSWWMLGLLVVKGLLLIILVMDLPLSWLTLVVHDLVTLGAAGLTGAYLAEPKRDRTTPQAVIATAAYGVVISFGTLTTAMGENPWFGKIQFDLAGWIPFAHAIIAASFLAILVAVARQYPVLIILQVCMFLVGATNFLSPTFASIVHSTLTPIVTAVMGYCFAIWTTREQMEKDIINPNKIWT